MSNRDDGGPAFPLSDSNAEYDRTSREHCNGMTLRDYFAAKVIQGICSSGPDRSWTDDMLACEAYRLADAMLQEREK